LPGPDIHPAATPAPLLIPPAANFFAVQDPLIAVSGPTPNIESAFEFARFGPRTNPLFATGSPGNQPT